MRTPASIAAGITLAVSLALPACRDGEGAEPTDPAGSAAVAAGVGAADRDAAHARPGASPRERAVLAAMETYKQAILERDTALLARIWTEHYTFINPQGLLVTRAERLANLGSGSTNVQIIDNEREITVHLFGDAAVVQNLSTLRGSFSGQPTDTDLRGTFVWVRRNGDWRLVTNQLTAVAP